jgi:hypothetical protein
VNSMASSTQNSCLGVLGAKEKKYTLCITSVDSDTSTTHGIVCLNDCLAPFTTWNLSRRTRMDLALSLSIAILQFYSTPWIDMWWTWKDFYMLKDEKSHVFINRKFYSIQNPHNVKARQPSRSQLAFWEIYQEPQLTRLGFALIELALGKRLVELRSQFSDDDQNLGEDALDVQTAMQIVERGFVLMEAGQIYNDVVQVCLRHQVITPSEIRVLSSEHKNFQQDLAQFVVRPLLDFHMVSWPQVAF